MAESWKYNTRNIYWNSPSLVFYMLNYCVWFFFCGGAHIFISFFIDHIFRTIQVSFTNWLCNYYSFSEKIWEVLQVPEISRTKTHFKRDVLNSWKGIATSKCALSVLRSQVDKKEKKNVMKSTVSEKGGKLTLKIIGTHKNFQFGLIRRKRIIYGTLCILKNRYLFSRFSLRVSQTTPKR